MDFSFGGHKSIGVVLREIGISGIMNEVRIIILFCFIDYPKEGDDPNFLYFSSRTIGQIEKSVNEALGKQWKSLHHNQVMLDIKELSNLGFVREVGGKYEFTRVGQVIARCLYDFGSIASENYETRKRD